MPPGPLKDFSMNLFLAKQVHHLLGLPSAVSKTFSHTLWPKNVKLSCKICLLKPFFLTCFVSELQKILSYEIRLFSG